VIKTEQAANGKKRRSRRKPEPDNAAVTVDETCKQLEEELQQRQAKVAARELERKRLEDELRLAEEEWNRVDSATALLEEKVKSREEEAQKRIAQSTDAASARKTIEAQRHRLEEALLLAKQRKRTEEPPVVVAATQHLEDATRASDTASVAESELTVIDAATTEKGIAPISSNGDLLAKVLEGLNSKSSGDRASALTDLSRIACDQAFSAISKAFDDPSPEVRNAAAKALYGLEPDPSSAFTRALRAATPERRQQIGISIAGSGLASDALGSLSGQSREKKHEALTLLFLMAKAGEIRPLMTTIEDDQNLEVRLTVVNLLALTGRADIIPPFRRLAVRGSLPAEVRSAVMEAIYQISSQQRENRL
jgi:hypothetical protein